MEKRFRHKTYTTVVLAVLACGCAIGYREPRLHEPAAPPAAGKDLSELKVHLKSGELVVLRKWKAAPGEGRLTGEGQAYTVTREEKGPAGQQEIRLSDVALLETNSPAETYSIGMGVVTTTTVILGGISGYCTISPKGCFGSCPTFYLEGERGGEPGRPQAEGFSESIARVLEARDVDALVAARPGGSDVSIVMRNEALETHAVRRVRLLAAPRPRGGRVLAGTDGRFYPTPGLVPPLECRAAEGDCRDALRDIDGRDRASTADGQDLAAREEIDLQFPSAHGRSGIAIAARQTLLSTFLFYQTMAYTGRGAGEFLATLERGGPDAGRRALGMARVLGGIDVELAEGDGPWRPIGRFDEAGPIAGDLQVVPFEGSGTGPLHVRLHMARGHWRLDAVALAALEEPVAPVAVEPASVERDGRPDEQARATLAHGGEHLVTRPGDAYRITFRLPPNGAPLELFLESEGFYYEWMRSEWLAEEDPVMAALTLADPAGALRHLAPAYKAEEPRLEHAFWASRFR